MTDTRTLKNRYGPSLQNEIR